MNKIINYRYGDKRYVNKTWLEYCEQLETLSVHKILNSDLTFTTSDLKYIQLFLWKYIVTNESYDLIPYMICIKTLINFGLSIKILNFEYQHYEQICMILETTKGSINSEEVNTNAYICLLLDRYLNNQHNLL